MTDTATPLNIEDIRHLDGLAVVRGMIAGSLPPPPIKQLVEFDLLTAERGNVTMQATPGGQHRNPFGTVHGGWSATVLDSAMTLACLTTVPVGHTVTTLEFKLTFIRPVRAGELTRVESTVLNAGRRTATAVGELKDAAGKLLVHATSTCLVMAL